MPSDAPLFLGHDLGTGGDKAVLVDLDGRLVATAFAEYDLLHPEPGWAEQDPAHYWAAVAATTSAVLADAGVSPGRVKGVGFAGQMLTMVPLDSSGQPTRRAISWIDNRADHDARRLVRRRGGRAVVRALAGAVPSGKDIVCKLAWIKRNEPDVFRRTAAFCDATGYLVARATGEIIADHTAGSGTGLLNRKTRRWDPLLVVLTGAPRAKLPALRACADVVGGLTDRASVELGLVAGTPVIAGMGDVPAAQVGAGGVHPGDAHLCLATSGWLCATVSEPTDIARRGIYSLAAAHPDQFAMVGESETVGECLDWLATQFHTDVPVLLAEADAVPAGSDGLLFLPWLFGERSPVTDTALRGGFLGLSLDHGTAHMARAVIEGIAYNLRWLVETFADAGSLTGELRVIGGGARSELWLQILADVIRWPLSRVADPHHVGAIGAALTAAVGTGHLDGYDAIGPLVRIDRTFTPTADPALIALHDRRYRALRRAQRLASTLVPYL